MSGKTSTKAKQPKRSNDGIMDMAAMLFAELFYRQVMEERKAKWQD